MLAKRRRRATHINSNIDNASLDNTYQFGLRGSTTLEMKATQNATTRLRLIVLHKVHLSNVFFELCLFPSFKKIASCIVEYARFYNIYSFDCCFLIIHRFKNLGAKVVLFFENGAFLSFFYLQV